MQKLAQQGKRKTIVSKKAERKPASSWIAYQGEATTASSLSLDARIAAGESGIWDGDRAIGHVSVNGIRAD